MFGGMDMFALDVLHTAEGNDFILEINDYAMGTPLMLESFILSHLEGFDFDYEEEDMKHVCELVVQRMNEKFCGVNVMNYVGQYVQSTAKRGDFKKTRV